MLAGRWQAAADGGALGARCGPAGALAPPRPRRGTRGTRAPGRHRRPDRADRSSGTGMPPACRAPRTAVTEPGEPVRADRPRDRRPGLLVGACRTPAWPSSCTCPRRPSATTSPQCCTSWASRPGRARWRPRYGGGSSRPNPLALNPGRCPLRPNMGTRRCAAGRAGVDFQVRTRVRQIERNTLMPLFMDVHNLGGPVTLRRRGQGPRRRPADAGRVRRALPALLGRRGAGQIFCLVDAPSAEAATTVHREAHGLLADEIYEVAEGE